jgi:hypothetical protein
MSPNAGGEVAGFTANEYSRAHGAQINIGDGDPYLTYDLSLRCAVRIPFRLFVPNKNVSEKTGAS